MWFWLIPVIIVILFIAIICIRAALFVPKKSDKPIAKREIIEVDGERAVRNLQALIRCETITPDTYEKPSPYEKDFEEFRALLPKLYPLVHERCTFERVGPGGLLFHWKGKSSDKPSVFMSHYDVVPAEEGKWQKPPFSGTREKCEKSSQMEIWGRGTLDTKGTLCAALEAAETLLSQGFTPEQDIYFSFVAVSTNER